MKTIRELILKDIIAEKMCKHPDKNYVLQSQNIIGQLKDLDHKAFIETGRIMPSASFLDRHPKEKLTQGTKSVCRYLGGFHIEFIDKNKFSWGWHEDKSLEHVEHTLFNHIKELINEQEG